MREGILISVAKTFVDQDIYKDIFVEQLSHHGYPRRAWFEIMGRLSSGAQAAAWSDISPDGIRMPHRANQPSYVEDSVS